MINSDFVKKRVVIYARVSTEHEAQISALENQMDWYRPILAARPEWTLVGQYVDEGITGTSAAKRPQFMKMIADAKKKQFDMIITREVSRFARNTVDTLQYTRQLKSLGVEVFFINDNIKTFDGDGELRLTIMATLAQDESRKTSVRVKSGQQTSMNNGVIYGNGNILGYKRVAKIVDDNKREVEWTVEPEQAKTVKMIYAMYLDGMGLMQIKDELERRGRKTSAGLDRWHCTVISHILKNSFYCGIITYHKEYTPDYLTQKKVKNYGEIEFTKVQGSHEALVSVADYERVQIIMESKRSKCKNLDTGRKTTGKRPRTTVWGKLLVCECGHKFSMRVWDRKDRVANAAYQDVRAALSYFNSSFGFSSDYAVIDAAYYYYDEEKQMNIPQEVKAEDVARIDKYDLQDRIYYYSEQLYGYNNGNRLIELTTEEIKKEIEERYMANNPDASFVPYWYYTNMYNSSYGAVGKVEYYTAAIAQGNAALQTETKAKIETLLAEMDAHLAAIDAQFAGYITDVVEPAEKAYTTAYTTLMDKFTKIDADLAEANAQKFAKKPVLDKINAAIAVYLSQEMKPDGTPVKSTTLDDLRAELKGIYDAAVADVYERETTLIEKKEALQAVIDGTKEPVAAQQEAVAEAQAALEAAQAELKAASEALQAEIERISATDAE